MSQVCKSQAGRKSEDPVLGPDRPLPSLHSAGPAGTQTRRGDGRHRHFPPLPRPPQLETNPTGDCAEAGAAVPGFCWSAQAWLCRHQRLRGGGEAARGAEGTAWEAGPRRSPMGRDDAARGGSAAHPPLACPRAPSGPRDWTRGPPLLPQGTVRPGQVCRPREHPGAPERPGIVVNGPRGLGTASRRCPVSPARSFPAPDDTAAPGTPAAIWKARRFLGSRGGGAGGGATARRRGLSLPPAGLQRCGPGSPPASGLFGFSNLHVYYPPELNTGSRCWASPSPPSPVSVQFGLEGNLPRSLFLPWGFR